MFVRLACLILALVATDVARAQGMVSLSLERGRLRIDGRTIAEDALPPTLDLRRINGTMAYSGSADASFDVGGVRYRVEDGRFVLDRHPARAPDVVFDANHALDVLAGGYVFVPVDWTSNPEAARHLRYAAQQEFALDATAALYAAQIRSMAVGDPQRAALAHQLRRTLRETFDVKQRNRLHEIELLEAELRFLRAQHQKRNAYRDEIVEQRLEALLSGQ